MSTPKKRKSATPAKLDPSDLTLTARDAWMTYEEVCAVLGESRNTVNKWRARGLFPTALRKPNGRVMFKRVDVAEFIAKLEVAA